LAQIFLRGIKRVHVGCGPHAILPDWWNVDVRKFRGIDDVIDAAEPWPYTDLDFVFAEHFIEHLTLDRGLTLLIIHAGNSLHFQTGQVDFPALPSVKVLFDES
jgi:predicted SAM-dependent methyltransferase